MSISIISVIAIIAVTFFLTLKKAIVIVFEDGIKIKDTLFPLTISNDTIISISLLDEMPRIVARNNGASLGYVTKGRCKIKRNESEGSEKAFVYYTKKGRKTIEIKTLNGSVFINRAVDFETEELYNEMKSTVKILKDNELDYSAKGPRSHRNTIIVTLIVIALVCIPMFLIDYGNTITVNNDVIEIKGDYAMDIPLSDIDTVLLVEQLPSIKLRTNGISTNKVNIGNFKTSNGDKCRLYVNNSTPIFVEIRLDAHGSQPTALIFINKKTVEETKALYDKIYDLRFKE